MPAIEQDFSTWLSLVRTLSLLLSSLLAMSSVADGDDLGPVQIMLKGNMEKGDANSAEMESRQWHPHIPISVVWLNKRASLVTVGRVPIDYDLDLSVVDEAGKKVPRTKFGLLIETLKADENISSLPFVFDRIAPRGEVTYVIDVAHQFDFSMPGTYFLQATRFVALHGEGDSGVIETNRLKIIVSEDSIRVEKLKDE